MMSTRFRKVGHVRVIFWACASSLLAVLGGS